MEQVMSYYSLLPGIQTCGEAVPVRNWRVADVQAAGTEEPLPNGSRQLVMLMRCRLMMRNTLIRFGTDRDLLCSVAVKPQSMCFSSAAAIPCT